MKDKNNRLVHTHIKTKDKYLSFCHFEEVESNATPIQKHVEK
jgi:hypothetical protein